MKNILRENLFNFSHHFMSLWLKEWQSFHHTTRCIIANEQKIHPVENCYYHKHCENTKTTKKEVNINMRGEKSCRKSLKQQQENLLRRTKTEEEEVFLSSCTHDLRVFTTEFSSDVFKDFAFKGLAFSSLSFEISLTTTWEREGEYIRWNLNISSLFACIVSS